MSVTFKSKTSKLLASKKFKKAVLITSPFIYALSIYFTFNPEVFTRHGLPGVFIFNIFGPGTILVPSLSRHMSILGVSLAGAAGMSINDSLGWLIGMSGDVVLPRSKKIEKLENTLHKWGPYALFTWALIPFPYDIVAIIAGYTRFPYKKFVTPVFLGRFIRFALLGIGVVSIWGKA